MRRWDPRNAELAREADAAAAELSGTLDDLLAASQNVPDLAAEVQVARTQHGFLAAAGGDPLVVLGGNLMGRRAWIHYFRRLF